MCNISSLLIKVASFHNTIGDRMINSQRSMMLSSARELAKLVQTQNTVTWENSKLVDDYIKKLQSVVKNIACQNNKLIHYHTRVMSKVCIFTVLCLVFRFFVAINSVPKKKENQTLDTLKKKIIV